MKRYMIHLLTALMVLTLAACDFDITNPGGGGTGNEGGGRGNGNGRDDGGTEVIMVESVEGDIVATPCDGTFIVESISVDENGNFNVVVGMETSMCIEYITLTEMNQGFGLGYCEIQLVGVDGIVDRRTGETQYIAIFQIFK